MPVSPYAQLDRPPLNAAALRRALIEPRGLVSDVQVVASTGSSNADVVALAERGADEGLLYVAEHQSAGRGRLDRDWTTPARSGLTFSLLLRPTDVPPKRWTWLPLLVGCAVQQTLLELAGVPAELKWPNDVLVEGRKLCGILLQRVDAGDGPAAAVVGVGLNVSLTAEELPTPTATSLVLENASCVDRDPLLRALVRNLATLYAAWRAEGGDPVGGPDGGLRAAYAGRCGTLGRLVQVHLGDGVVVEGRAEDVDTDGRLIVVHGGERTAYGAGDVVHVR